MATMAVDLVINVNTGTEELPKYTPVAGRRGAQLTRSTDTVDTTSADGDGWGEAEPTFKRWSINADGLYVEDDVAFQALEEAWLNNKKVLVQMVMPSGKKQEGKAIITDFPIDAPYSDAMTYSITLQGDGPLTPTPAV